MTLSITHRRLVAFATVVALLSGGLVGLGTGAQVAQPSTRASQDDPTSFHWEAPRNATGTFAALVQVTVEQEAWCEVVTRAEGVFNASNPVAYWDTIRSDIAGGTFAGHWHHPAQAHAGPADPRFVTAPEGRWHKVGGETGLLIRHRLNLTIAAFDLAYRNGTQADGPLSIDIDCDQPITVRLQAGRRAHSFTPESLEGGVGASVSVGENAAVAVQDRLTETFETAHVRFQASMFTDIITRAGSLSLEHPAGSETWSWDPDGPHDIQVDGGPGTYDVVLDGYAQAGNSELAGILVGLDPVDSLDEAM